VALFAMRTLAKSLCVRWPSVNARAGQILCVPTDMIKDLFIVVRSVRNDICHHRKIGESISYNPKYRKQKMTKSQVLNALEDLKILLGYDNTFDVKSMDLKYNT
jgi:hypothetical protein